jgi:hypothetical protein
VQTAQADGLLLEEQLTRRSSPPVWGAVPSSTRASAVLHHGATTVRVLAPDADGGYVVLAVRRAGSSWRHFAVLGLGPDGRVAARILASVTATG